MPRCNKTAYAILGLISKQPASGYDIKQELAHTSKWYWTETNAQIYPILKRMEEQGCLTSSVDASSGARKRRIYRITPQGSEKLTDWLMQPIQATTHREEFFLKFTFGQHLTNDEMTQMVTNFQQIINEQLKTIQQTQKHIETHFKHRQDYPYLVMSYRYATDVWQAKSDWCSSTISELEHKK